MSAEQLVLTLKGNRTSAPIQERPPETKQKGKDTLSSDGPGLTHLNSQYAQ